MNDKQCAKITYGPCKIIGNNIHAHDIHCLPDFSLLLK